VWLVFAEDESGGSGYYGGYGFDNGSHSVELIGVYGTKAAADAAVLVPIERKKMWMNTMGVMGSQDANGARLM
jgi:hypothetical protein